MKRCCNPWLLLKLRFGCMHPRLEGTAVTSHRLESGSGGRIFGPLCITMKDFDNKVALRTTLLWNFLAAKLGLVVGLTTWTTMSLSWKTNWLLKLSCTKPEAFSNGGRPWKQLARVLRPGCHRLYRFYQQQFVTETAGATWFSTIAGFNGARIICLNVFKFLRAHRLPLENRCGYRRTWFFIVSFWYTCPYAF